MALPDEQLLNRKQWKRIVKKLLGKKKKRKRVKVWPRWSWISSPSLCPRRADETRTSNSPCCFLLSQSDSPQRIPGKITLGNGGGGLKQFHPLFESVETAVGYP